MHPDWKTFKATITNKAETLITTKSNYGLGDKDRASLGYYFDEAIQILRNWRKIAVDDETEFLAGVYDYAIVEYIIEQYQVGGSSNLSSLNTGISSRTIRIDPRTNLESKYSQRL